jgi:hypothetical protein
MEILQNLINIDLKNQYYILMIHFFYNCINAMAGSPLEIVKAHVGLLSYFKEDPEVSFYENIDITSAINIIEKSENDMFMIYAASTPFEKSMMDFVQNPQKNKIVFLNYDYWPHVQWPREHYNQEYVVSKMFHANNHYIITFAQNMEQINDMWNTDFSKYKDKIIFSNIWCCYPSSFIEFNTNPINKILLFGNIVDVHYPERYFMRELSKTNGNIVELMRTSNDYRDNIFNIKLSNFICCFASSVYVYYKKYNQYRNTNILLLKVFEILAAGSLLLYPKHEEEYINKFGLYHMKNCILTDMNNMNETVNYIVDLNNRQIIDDIRRNGQKHAMEKFNSYEKYKDIKNITTLK